MSLVALEGVNFAFGTRRVLDAVSMGVEAGELLVVLGPSGIGKTTLLRILEGSLHPASGSVRRENSVTSPGRIRRVWQDPRGALNPLRAVVESVASARRHLLGDAPELARAAARRRLQDVGLALADEETLPAALSAGQRQRAALARALVTDPVLLLADEPTAALDPIAQRDLLAIVRAECVRRGMAAVLVLHDPVTVPGFADRYIVLGEQGVAATGWGVAFAADGHPAVRAVRGEI